MEQTPATRFVDVLGRLGYKTQQQIADLLDIARPTAGTIVRYEKPPSFESVATLKEKHPEINMEWVFTGNGAAFVTGDVPPIRQDEVVNVKATEEVPRPGQLIVSHSLASMTDAQRAAWWQARYEQLQQEVERGANREATLIQLLGKNEASADAANPNETGTECRVLQMPLEMPEFTRFRPTPPRRNAIGF